MTSPTPSCDTIGSTASNSSEGESDGNLNTKCSQCNEIYSIPKVLDCFHSFCQPCLEKLPHTAEKISCPDCSHETTLPSTGVSGLLPDFAVTNMLEATAMDSNMLTCTGCKSKDTKAVARCFDCANFLCPNCVMAHQFMHCFEGHRVLSLTEGQATKEEVRLEKPVSCNKHKNEYLKFYCRTCNVPICQECTMVEHAQGHEYETLNMISGPQIEALQQLADQAKVKASDLRGCAKGIEHSSNKLQIEFQKAQNEVNETYNFYRSQLEERKTEALKELDVAYTAKQNHLSGVAQKIQDAIERLYQGCEFVEKLIKHAGSSEILMYSKTLNTKMQNVINFSPNVNTQNAYHVEFVSNYQAIQVGIRNTFGYVRQSPDMQQKNGTARQNGFSPRTVTNNTTTSTNMTNGFDPNLLVPKPHYASTNSLSSITASDTGMSSMSNMYEKWSNGGLDIMQNGTDVFSTAADPMVDLTSKLITANIYPPKSQLKRQKMIYHCKFGEFGVMEGQFTEPSGVAVNAQGDIIVADTNNHRIQIFDKEGRFKFQFGECGKRDGQLLYPNRVAVVKTSGDIVVTERSPTHQVQIFNQYGQFVRKFGANILQHPRGVTVDNKGRIIIVECKVMRVIIFDQLGNMLQKFSCSKHLEFPNGVVVNDKEEIFISDNRAHCVKVFDYQGVFLRQIGGEGVTNYPIGVGINSAGEILVADNHNNFNLTVFMQDGQLITALESKVKHAQCFDVALVDDGSVVLASKDYRLYIYRYMQVAGFSF